VSGGWKNGSFCTQERGKNVELGLELHDRQGKRDNKPGTREFVPK